MAMTLSTDAPTNYTRHNGGEVLSLPAGGRIRIQTNDGGGTVDMLDETVPAGKVWEVAVSIYIEESDA